VISPTGWESQENGNGSINAINLAIDQFAILKAIYVTGNFVIRNEIEDKTAWALAAADSLAPRSAFTISSRK
jgi:hypothetical protein